MGEPSCRVVSILSETLDTAHEPSVPLPFSKAHYSPLTRKPFTERDDGNAFALETASPSYVHQASKLLKESNPRTVRVLLWKASALPPQHTLLLCPVFLPRVHHS